MLPPRAQASTWRVPRALVGALGGNKSSAEHPAGCGSGSVTAQRWTGVAYVPAAPGGRTGGHVKGLNAFSYLRAKLFLSFGAGHELLWNNLVTPRFVFWGTFGGHITCQRQSGSGGLIIFQVWNLTLTPTPPHPTPVVRAVGGHVIGGRWSCIQYP